VPPCEDLFLFYDSQDIAHLVTVCCIQFVRGLFLSKYNFSDQVDGHGNFSDIGSSQDRINMILVRK
jgi:hypothetical protein